MDAILNYINQSKEIIVAIGALIVTAIAIYKQVRAELETIANKQFNNAVAPLVAAAEVKPMVLAQSLVNKPDMLSSLDMNSNTGKKNIVAQAMMEREPKLLKKLKLKDAIQVGAAVSNFYQTIGKPIIKALGK